MIAKPRHPLPRVARVDTKGRSVHSLLLHCCAYQCREASQTHAHLPDQITTSAILALFVLRSKKGN